MDPVSFLFSTYLNSVQSAVYNNMTETMGTEVKAVVIEYEGMEVPFQYQMWRVREQSVCANLKNRTAVYSECTVKASRLFSDLCQTMTGMDNSDMYFKKAKNMYCSAAISYRPEIAKISEPVEKTNLQKAKSACNSATVAAMGSHDVSVLHNRDKLCEEYKKLKTGS